MRRTLNWKHNGKDRKQYIRDGKVRIDGWLVPMTATEGYWKRNTDFMDLSDVDLKD